MHRVDPKKFYEEQSENYGDEKRGAFLDEVMLVAVSYLDDLDLEEDNFSFADFSEKFIEEFSFPDKDKWITDEKESILDELGDIKRDLEGDR